MNQPIMSDASTWLFDSGASHHMTSDLANLSLHNLYGGGDGVLLGDGSSLNIFHTGSLYLPSYTRPFFFNSVLCVPSLQKNLISVFQLCSTNGVELLLPHTFRSETCRRGLYVWRANLKMIPMNDHFQKPLNLLLLLLLQLSRPLCLIGTRVLVILLFQFFKN